MATTDPANELSAFNKLTVTGLSASTCPTSVPEPAGGSVAVGDPTGVEDVGVADSTGVEVADSTGVEVAVSDPFGVEVAVADPSGVEVAVSDPSGVEVAVADPSGVAVTVAEPSGVEVAVADPSGVEVAVADSKGVGVDVAVGILPTMVRLVPVEGRLVRTLSPFETRAVHSIAV